jgi:hypothetical protein
MIEVGAHLNFSRQDSDMLAHRCRLLLATALGAVCATVISCQTAPPPPRPPARDAVNVKVDGAGNVAVNGGGAGVTVRPGAP